MLNYSVLMMAPPAEGGGGMAGWIFPVAIFVVFYFFMIRPQQQKAKKTKEFRENLTKGANIVTIGGIHGKIESLKESSVIITTKGGGKLEIERAAISAEGSADELEMSNNKG